MIKIIVDMGVVLSKGQRFLIQKSTASGPVIRNLDSEIFRNKKSCHLEKYERPHFLFHDILEASQDFYI